MKKLNEFKEAIKITESDNSVYLDLAVTLNKNSEEVGSIITPLMQKANIAKVKQKLEPEEKGQLVEGYYNNTDAYLFMSSVLNNRDYDIYKDNNGCEINYIQQRAKAFNNSIRTEIANKISNSFIKFLITLDSNLNSLEISKDAKNICIRIIDRLTCLFIYSHEFLDEDATDINDQGIGYKPLLLRLSKDILQNIMYNELDTMYFLNTILPRYMNEISLFINSYCKLYTTKELIYNVKNEDYEYILANVEVIVNNCLSELHNDLIQDYCSVANLASTKGFREAIIPENVNLDNLELLTNTNNSTLYNSTLLLGK